MQIKEQTKRGWNVCYSGHPCDFHTSTLPFDIPACDVWTCFDLTFETKVPMPDDKFSISISGLKLNSVSYDIPKIYFEVEKCVKYDSAP